LGEEFRRGTLIKPDRSSDLFEPRAANVARRQKGEGCRMGTALDGKQRLMREVNDRILESLEGFGSEDGDFLCECGEESCAETIQLTLREYAALKARGDGEVLRSPTHARQPAS
jgi:hypothetical protein